MLFASAYIGSDLCSYDQKYRLASCVGADVACLGTFRFGDSVLFSFGEKWRRGKPDKFQKNVSSEGKPRMFFHGMGLEYYDSFL